jgi:hypothetical protein
MALSRGVDNAHSLRHDTRVDRDRARLHPLLGAFAPDAASGELSPLSGGKAGGASGECEQREMSKKVAHFDLEAWAGAHEERRRRLGG